MGRIIPTANYRLSEAKYRHGRLPHSYLLCTLPVVPGSGTQALVHSGIGRRCCCTDPYLQPAAYGAEAAVCTLPQSHPVPVSEQGPYSKHIPCLASRKKFPETFTILSLILFSEIPADDEKQSSQPAMLLSKFSIHSYAGRVS